MIAIIDYGMGNLASVQNALSQLGLTSISTSNPEELLKARKVILPGVGAFGDAMKNLQQLGLDQAIGEVLRRGTPLLGICLGLQLLFSESEENGLHRGLGLIPGRVKKLPPTNKVPHIGWNNIEVESGKRLLRGISSGSYFYFVHSFYVIPEDVSVVAARCNYGLDFVCAVEKDRLFATQFHPEKSGAIGLSILKNFGEMPE